MNNEDWRAIGLRAFAWIGGFLVGVVVGISIENTENRREAVINGHAEWVSDSQGSAKFKWKDGK